MSSIIPRAADSVGLPGESNLIGMRSTISSWVRLPALVALKVTLPAGTLVTEGRTYISPSWAVTT
jgi:hypothetical protein